MSEWQEIVDFLLQNWESKFELDILRNFNKTFIQIPINAKYAMFSGIKTNTTINGEVLCSVAFYDKYDELIKVYSTELHFSDYQIMRNMQHGSINIPNNNTCPHSNKRKSQMFNGDEFWYCPDCKQEI